MREGWRRIGGDRVAAATSKVRHPIGLRPGEAGSVGILFPLPPYLEWVMR